MTIASHPTQQNMEREYFLPLISSIKLSVFRNADFDTLLNCRLVCSDWNDLISIDILPYRSHLNIQVDKSKACKRFRKGEWVENINGYWDEVRVHYPEDPSKFSNIYIFNWGKQSSFRCFPAVTKVSFFDCGKAAFVDFVHSILAGLPHLRHVEIKSQHWISHALLRLQPSLSCRSTLSSWTEALKQVAKLTTFRIKVFDKRTTIKYLNLLSSVDLNLVTLDVDFSVNFGLPFDPITLDELSQLLLQVIANCVDTLQYLRIKWDHRVEGDLDLVRYSRDFDPFAQFILMVSSNTELFHRLHLKRLALNFPVMAFAPANLMNEVMVPFILSQQPTLEKVTFSRVRWETNVRQFLSNFTPRFVERIEMGVFMVDVDTWIQDGLKLLKGVSKVEFHSLGTICFDLNAINARKSRCRRTGTVKFKKQNLTSLRFQNSVMNPALSRINIKDILHNFRLLQDLELIDHSYNTETRSHSNSDLNHIFLKLPHLKSLKMTNLSEISDAGLTQMSSCEISRMMETGVFYPAPSFRSIPMIRARNLAFLELRDLGESVTDLSAYFAFQFIPNLEKIALYGNHKISDWGEHVLIRRFKRNPCFELHLSQDTISSDFNNDYLLDFP